MKKVEILTNKQANIPQNQLALLAPGQPTSLSKSVLRPSGPPREPPGCWRRGGGGGWVAAAAGTAALVKAAAVFRPRPLMLVLGGWVIPRAGGSQHNSPLDRKVDPFSLPPLAAPSQQDPMLHGHVEVCGPLPLQSAAELPQMLVVMVEPELELRQLLELPRLGGVAPCCSSVEAKQKKRFSPFTNNIWEVHI